MKKILITGKNSYIGTSFEKWMSQYPDEYSIDTIDMKDGSWRDHDFSKYDVVFHVAGIAHVKETKKNREMYYKVNRDLPIEVAEKAKKCGIKQFIFMSTMAVYGEDGKIGKEVVINHNTPVNPKTHYGISKFEAEIQLINLSEDSFRIALLRPPMVYGPNCPGNYAKLEKLASKTPLFPMIVNKRSTVSIFKLCQNIKEIIDNETDGFYFPQDDQYFCTSYLVKALAEKNGHSVHLSRLVGMIICLFGSKVSYFNKIFGNLIYEKN
jgi:nucleoside-diphosphate-sugar epimerase